MLQIHQLKEHSKEISMFDYRWPFLIVSAGFASVMHPYFKHHLSSSRCYHSKFSRICSFCKYWFYVGRIRVLNGQLLVADRLQTSPGSLIKLGYIQFNIFVRFCFSESLIEAYFCLFSLVWEWDVGPRISSSLSLSVGKDNQGAAGGFLERSYL